jgi:hypothetical protein
VLGASKEESIGIANYLNCKEGELPMKYLGVPVTLAKLYTTDVIYVGLEVEQYYQLGKVCWSHLVGNHF